MSSSSAGSSSTTNTGVIHDLGYRRYDGPRLGRLHIGYALYWHSFRSAFGIGRGAKAKIVPLIAFGIMCLPAVVEAIVIANGGTRDISYDSYQFEVRILVMTIFLAAQAPELVSRDLRSHVLPLYFARPLRRLDYPMAKYAAFVTACLVMIEVPLLLLYLGTITQVHGGGAVWSETKALAGGLLIGVLWAVLLAAIGLVLASLSGRRAYATGAIAIYFFLTFTLAGIVFSATDPVKGPAVTAGPPTRAMLAGLISPFTVLDGVRQWFGGEPVHGAIELMGHYGPAYGIVFIAALAASLGGLAARYAKIGVA
jgi:ABC-2 type transport system permease protein